MVRGTARARQIGSEYLIMPDTCPVGPPRCVLPAQGVVDLFSEKRKIRHGRAD